MFFCARFFNYGYLHSDINLKKIIMNKFKLFLSLLAFPVVSVGLSSCDDCDDYDRTLVLPSAVVTVCPQEDGGFMMVLDDENDIYPANMDKSPFGENEVRAFVNFTPVESKPGDDRQYVNVNWLDEIRTKLPVAFIDDEDAATYGNDPVEIVRDWVTVAEDGYLTLRLRTRWGLAGTVHHINLLSGVNPENPCEFELRHDAKGDVLGELGDAFIAFNLNKEFDDATGPVKIKLRWKSFSGEKSAEFDLALRKYIDDADHAALVPAARLN